MDHPNRNYTYILRCKDDTFYTGWTNDLDRRLKTHNEGKGAKYTRVRRPVALVYYEMFRTKEEAMRREWEIKQMTRRQKEELVQQNIEKQNQKMLQEGEIRFQFCTIEDLEAVMELQRKISAAMEQKEWFAETSREENRKFFKAPNLVLGVYDQDRLIAYGSMGFLEEDPENLGWDLEWEKDTVLGCANLDTIVVDPDYRGCGLQRELIRRCVERAQEEKPEGKILTTICPENVYSMRNAQAEGFEILLRTKKYGGKDRYILGKDL